MVLEVIKPHSAFFGYLFWWFFFEKKIPGQALLTFGRVSWTR